MLSPRIRELLSLPRDLMLSETGLVLAEGAMVTMIAAAMIPKAAHGKPSEVGLYRLVGFLADVLFKLLAGTESRVRSAIIGKGAVRGKTCWRLHSDPVVHIAGSGSLGDERFCRATGPTGGLVSPGSSEL